MFEELVEFIIENYRRAPKIVEVGVGHRIDVAKTLKKKLPSTEILVTDKDESWPRLHRGVHVKGVADDVMFPHLPLYEHSSLIYSLHPPLEVVPSLERLSGKIGADLLIVPISDEQGEFHRVGWQKIVRRGRTIGWFRPVQA